MNKIVKSLAVIAFVAAIAVGATSSYFSDTETSTGNTFTAGAIDLGIDNESYYNGLFNQGTSWNLDYDIETDEQGSPEVHQFFDFDDLKPGDWGEDTISLHVNNNESWLCADVKLTSDNDNTPTEPELDIDTNTGVGLGELADAIDFYWWADDGDNVYETDEKLLPAGSLGALGVGQTATVALADSTRNIWEGSGPIPKDSGTRYIGKAWCFGNSAFTPYPAQIKIGTDPDNNPIMVDDNSKPPVRPVICDGFGESNVTQTDSMTADISFRAVQARNNKDFKCVD